MNHGHAVRRALRLRLADVPGSLAEVARRFADHAIDIIRLEVLPDDGGRVFDDVEVGAAAIESIDAAVSELRAIGVDVVVLPPNWSVRDWVMEVFDAIDRLEGAASPGEELDALLSAANRLANTSHAVLLTESGDGDAGRALERWRAFEALAAVHSAGTVDWVGDADAIRRIEQVLAVSGSRGSDAGGRGIAIACDPAASTVLAVVGERPPFAPGEVARVERFGRLAVRLMFDQSSSWRGDRRARGLAARPVTVADGPALAVLARALPPGRLESREGPLTVDRWVAWMLNGAEVRLLEVSGPLGSEVVGAARFEEDGTDVYVSPEWESSGAAEMLSQTAPPAETPSTR